jgi:uncharacterized protein
MVLTAPLWEWAFRTRGRKVVPSRSERNLPHIQKERYLTFGKKQGSRSERSDSLDRVPKGLIGRRIMQILLARMHESPVVALQGARSVGKSTVLRLVADHHQVEVIDLDDETQRALAEASATDVVDGDSPVCIDEYQRVPAVLQAVKAQLNRNHENGRYVLTGSSSFWALPRGTQSLTGRLHLLEIMPLSQGEIDGVREDFLDIAMNEPDRLRTSRTTGMHRGEYAERICRGGLPLAIGAVGHARDRFFRSYVGTELARDVLDLANIRQVNVLPKLLDRLAGQSAQLLNVTKAGGEVGLEPRTADNYVRLLEALFLVRKLPAWGRTLRARATKAPKLHLVDSGLAAHLMGVNARKLERRDPAAIVEFGHLLETFVVGELLKQASWLDDVDHIGHWRTSDGAEVDLIIETFDGDVVAFEVKAHQEAGGRDAGGLRALRDSLGEQFRAGFILNTGPVAYRLEDRIHVCPIDRLWHSASSWS